MKGKKSPIFEMTARVTIRFVDGTNEVFDSDYSNPVAMKEGSYAVCRILKHPCSRGEDRITEEVLFPVATVKRISVVRTTKRIWR